MNNISNYGMTHAGKFHADDVFSSALLKIINPNIEIKRGFHVPEDFEGIIFDIGYGKYDHHQESAEVRENGVPYASFGLLWREFGESLVGAEEAARFDESFIQPLDEDDNTGCGNQLARVIGKWNPSWDSTESADECFQQVSAMAVEILKKEFAAISSIQRAQGLVQQALENIKDKIVVLPKFAPWKNVLIPSEAEFVAYPSQRGGFSAQVIPLDFDTNVPKCNFPEKWAGKSPDELRVISGVATLSFCHNNRFLISADTLEDVLKACQIARKSEKGESRYEK
ncbi:MAG TPA: MYG1 family protein [Oscillospiraceae bacterium]|nr:MYG1 family protein [Oscillospiraceae bacterium]